MAREYRRFRIKAVINNNQDGTIDIITSASEEELAQVLSFNANIVGNKLYDGKIIEDQNGNPRTS